jgi:hypothetical protein
MTPYVGAGVIVAVLCGNAAGPIGATIGVVILVAAIYVATKRNRRIQMTLTDTTLAICNGGDVSEFGWQDVESVEARWKYFGLFSPRGQMLHVTTRPETHRSGMFAYASGVVIRKATRRKVCEALMALSRRYDFALPADLGPGPFWRLERSQRE